MKKPKLDTSELEGAALEKFLEKQKTVVHEDLNDVSDLINRLHTKNNEYKESAQ